MNALPFELSTAGRADLTAVPLDLRPAVLEQLARIAANWQTCSRPTGFPRLPGAFESGLWCRHTGGADLIEVLFVIEARPDRVFIRRVILTNRDELPPWVTNPKEFKSDSPPWPVVDL